MKRAVLVFVLLNICACNTDGEEALQDTGPDSVDIQVQDQTIATDVTIPDEQSIELPPAEDLFDFVEQDEQEPGCEPGEGCFLDPCETNDECPSGWCVGHMGEDVCTQQCQSECPPGWSCQQVPGTAPDVIWICISDHANLCLPCVTGADCKGAAGADDVCVDYDSAGGFCGGMCTVDDDCPWGFSCANTKTVSSIDTKQCVADAGVCPCTTKSVELALYTLCETTSEFGTCEGKRICTEDGLTECDAHKATQEICDGIDNDCDSDTDEPDEVGGNYINLCNDDNPCTTDTCTGSEGCTHEPLSEGECADGDACTVGDHCEAGICEGLPVICDDDNDCTDDFCDGLGGCKTEFNSVECNDGDACTVADTCKEGTCVGVAVDCTCQNDADCGPDDDNLCNGTIYCDTDSFPYTCKVAPDSVVVCPVPADLSICLGVVCNSTTGTCGTEPAHEGYACDDGDACTVGEHCSAGACSDGVAPLCNDGNPCTDDSCDGTEGCLFVPNSKPCSDDNVCTLGDLCSEGTCLPGTGTLWCDDLNSCTDDSCQPDSGCVHLANDLNCDDGNACTSGDHCESGKCVPVDAVDCNDNNPCTADGCTPSGGCTHTIVAAPCNDGDPCTVNDLCINGICQSGTALECDDQNGCTADSCSPAGKCLHEALEGNCDDGNACTVDDHCDEGQCIATQSLQCGDVNICTTDLCDPVQGCIHLLNDSPCDDGDICTTGDHCHLGGCISAGQLTCDDGNACSDDSCDPQTGCVFKPNSNLCDDGNFCTQNDTCKNGACSPGDPMDCNDNNFCTDDLCDFVVGCMHFGNSLPCNDADACTANEFCANSACDGGVAIVCEDDNLCTDDSCHPDSGCVYEDNAATCDDNDACTDGDACSNGACAPGIDLDCDDSNFCTDDSCASETGCVHTPIADETPCGDELHCLTGACVAICNYVAGTKTFTKIKSIETWAVPECVESITIEAWGAEGGKNNPCPEGGGRGARMKGTFAVQEGDILKIVVGERGNNWGGDMANNAGSGGGGSFVWHQSGTQLLIAAGGGGGGAICTSGGNHADAPGIHGTTANNGTADKKNLHTGGTNGSDGTGGECRGKGWNNVQNNPAGYSGPIWGGYGGGGTVGSTHSGGGGGGYSGGGCTPYSPASGGGGGGSYNNGSNPDNAGGVRSGDGSVVISW
jgi:hypothetical protein